MKKRKGLKGAELADYSTEARCTALAARLRRLSDQIDRDCGKLYAISGVTFEQRWFGVLRQLQLNGPLTVGSVAALLGITHVSVIQTCQSMNKAGLITSEVASDDARVRVIRLTRKARALIKQLEPLWMQMRLASESLNQEAGDVIALLDRLDEALKVRSLVDRTLDESS